MNMEIIKTSRPDWIDVEKWDRLNRREKAFVTLWRRGVKDAKIQELLFFNSIAGVRVMRGRVMKKIRNASN